MLRNRREFQNKLNILKQRGFRSQKTVPIANVTALVFFLRIGCNFKGKNETESGLMIPRSGKGNCFCGGFVQVLISQIGVIFLFSFLSFFIFAIFWSHRALCGKAKS